MARGGDGSGPGGLLDWLLGRPDGTAPLEDSDIARIRAQADGNASWEDVDQFRIGDCYLPAVPQACPQTEEGRQALRDRVRWDQSRNAFVVTFYDEDGNKVETTVDDYYTDGNQSGPRTINVYEQAYAELLEDHTRNNSLSGGWPDDAVRDITGQDATHVDARASEGLLGWTVFWDDDSYTDQEWEQISEASTRGVPVVASTTSSEVVRDTLADEACPRLVQGPWAVD